MRNGITYRNLRSECSGAITVEMAIVAMAVFFMIPVLMDLTSLIANGITLSSSLRAGQQVALAQPSNTTAIREAITLSGGFEEDSVGVETETFCECDNISTLCTTSTCPGGGTPATFMTITASYSVPTALEYPDPNPFDITRTSTIRVR
jgi:hypothetical protein